MIFTLDEIRNRVTPVAQKYSLKAVYVFGSYARGEATADSDIDLLVDRTGSSIKGMFDMGRLYEDLRESIGKEIDIVTTQTLEQDSTKQRIPLFVDSLRKERVQVYGEI